MEFLQFLSEHRSLPLNVFFQLITLCAQESLVIGIICWHYWGRNKELAYTLGFSYFLSGLTVQALKITFRVPRPWVLNPDFHAVESALPAATGYSFPSGHTQSGTALFSTLGFAAKSSRSRALCFLMIVLIGFSRLYLGVHTPKDVLVSMVLTLTISSLVWRYGQHLLENRGYDALISLLMILLSCALILYTIALHSTGILPAPEAVDCFKTCGAGLGFAAGFYVERRYIHFTSPETPKEHFIRFLVGLLSSLIIQHGLKPVLGYSFFGHCLRYLIVVFWIIALYPLLFQNFKKFSQEKEDT